MKYLKVRLVKTDRTDLMCISCGMFRTEYEISNGGGEPQVGVHRHCLSYVKAKREVSSES